jgi:glycosyltransferase involved in cell wall biosynthesis
VHFLGERNDVAQLMPHFDCLWLASQYEGQSNAVLEAMAAGVPVVATDIAGNRDLVVHDQTGFLVPVGDRAGFARWTHRLLDDADMWRRCSQSAVARIGDEFSVEKMVQRHVELYETMG